MSKFIVLDVVFYANSLNYDQGSGNIQELKKITKWDGKQYTLVSRYALRYSILHHANNLFPEDWKLAEGGENGQLHLKKGGVVQAKGDQKELVKFPEFDLFGYMMTVKKSKNKSEEDEGEQGGATTRPAVAAISHAVSLVPFNYDSHFSANHDVANRAFHKGNLNPFTLEEHYSFYVYSIVIDVNRLGAVDPEPGKDPVKVLDSSAESERMGQLLETISSLKRQIKGRIEDLSPKLLIVGLYDGEPYKSFKDRIALADEYEEEFTQTEEKVENGTKIVRRTVKTNKPKFCVYGLAELKAQPAESIKNAVSEFVAKNGTAKQPVLFYKAPGVDVEFK